MEDKLLINVQIVDRTYPVRVKRTDSKSEATIRQAAKGVNDAIKSLKSLGLKNKDEQDYLALVGIQFAVKALDAEDQLQLEPLLEELREINFNLSSYLEDE